MELYKAHRQWASRPKDERFPSVQALCDATKAYADTAIETSRPWSDLRTEAVGEDVQLVGKKNTPATLTNWAFGQLCARVEAPANFLRRLTSTLSSHVLNNLLAERGKTEPAGQAQLLIHTNDGLLIRALTSDKYARVWNYEVADRLLGLEQYGWTPARPDTQFAPSIGVFIPKEESDFPALYASDHDMFVFLVNAQIVLEVEGGRLRKGIIVENSEVGAAMLRLTRFYYDKMCGNHIIWGARDVVEIALRHVGRVRERWGEYEVALSRFANESTSDIEAKIASAKTKILGGTKEEVLDRLFGLRSLGLSRKVLTGGYEAQETLVATGVEENDPRTQYGIVQGLTRFSQTLGFADRRQDIDRAAGRILELDF